VRKDESVTFSIRDLQVIISVSQSVQVVQQATGVAEVDTDDVAQDSDTASELSWSELVVLVVVESEEAGTEDGVVASTSDQAFELLDSTRDNGEVAVEDVVVVVDESQVHGDQESELSQVDRVGVAGEVSKLESGIQELSTDLLSDEEVDEAAVGLGELEERELVVLIEVALFPEGGDDLVLVVLTLDDVLEVLLSNDTTSLGGKELANIDSEGGGR